MSLPHASQNWSILSSETGILRFAAISGTVDAVSIMKTFMISLAPVGSIHSTSTFTLYIRPGNKTGNSGLLPRCLYIVSLKLRQIRELRIGFLERLEISSFILKTGPIPSYL